MIWIYETQYGVECIKDNNVVWHVYKTLVCGMYKRQYGVECIKHNMVWNV